MNQQLDCAFLPRPINTELSYIPMDRDQYYAILSGEIKYIDEEKISLSVFEKEPFVLPCEGMEYDLGNVFRNIGLAYHINKKINPLVKAFMAETLKWNAKNNTSI